MARNRKPLRYSRRGVVAAFVALAITAVLTMVAVALDGGSLQDRRRNAQAVADAAAMAAAADLYTNNPISGVDVGGTAKTAALTVAATNGYQNDANPQHTDGNGNDDSKSYNLNRTKVTVNIPPVQGPYTGLPGYCEVLVSYFQPIYFGRVTGTQVVEVQARAVSRGGWTGLGAGVIVLDPTGSDAFKTQGGGSFYDSQGPIIIDSNNASALTIGGGGSVTATAAYITGNYTTPGGGTLATTPTTDQVFTGYHPTPDPFAYIPEPSVPPDGTITKRNNPDGTGFIYTLTPGRFSFSGQNKLPNFTNGDVVVFTQASGGNGGIYYIDGGGFTSNGASLLMDTATTGGIMIYNNPRPNDATNNAINIAGGAADVVVNLSPLTSGPYAGITLFQERSSTVGMSISGSGNFSMTGAFYAAGAQLTVAGNGGSTLLKDGTPVAGSQIGSQYISYDLTITGNGNVYMGYGGDTGRTRTITLVE